MPRITRIGACCFTASALSRSSSISSEEQVLLGFGGRLPAGESVGEEDAGALVGLVREGRAEAVQEQADLQVADDERRRQDLEAEDAAHGGLFQIVGEERVVTLLAQRARRSVEHLDKVGAGAAAGVEHDDARIGEAIGDAESERSTWSTRATMYVTISGGVYQTPSSLRSSGSNASRNGS